MVKTLLHRLERPEGRVRAVLDTDAYNEIDDQFALAYMLKKPKKFHIQALTAAPFHNEKSSGPGDGMRKSYQEILHILRLTNREDMQNRVFEGSDTYLPDEKKPVESPAARELVRLAKEGSPDDPLYIIAIGAITNVASALLLDSSMAERCVIVWLGGHAWHWPDTREFNMQQDVAAARVVFDSGAPVVQFPCMGVVSELRTTGPELGYWLRGKNELCEYLVRHTNDEVASYAGGTAWSRVIWDVSAVAWFIDPHFTSGRVAPSPICGYDHRYSFDAARHPCRVIDAIDRDKIFTDLFKTLA
ncbi:MAG: nucleoside hydrolase, partial [Oscillospiraceae bacterium]|nr:nucleoside hydrolase [Oscillospiraceae bacterium]